MSMADIAGDTITVNDSGGINTHIAWNVIAVDDSGNTIEEARGTLVVKPGKNK